VFKLFLVILEVVGALLFLYVALHAITNIKAIYDYKKKNVIGFKEALYRVKLKPNLFEFIKWFVLDLKTIKDLKFNEYGLTVFCGRQGEGKSISMIDYLERIKLRYPNCKVVTNFRYDNGDLLMDSWQQLVDYRNGEDGVIFAIDEIQNEYDSTKWADFPENLLSEVTMQRKQKVKIVASSQVYGRIVKQLREQCFDVVECWTLANRWTFQTCYDAWDYNVCLDNPEKKNKLKKKWKYNFVQTNNIRTLYDTMEKIKKLASVKQIPRISRAK
jgi:ATP-dependent Clp protease ATP-binding subunit ClpX